LLESLITSKTRIKLLLRFFLNPNSTAYLRNLEAEFHESSNAIRVELNRFEKAKLLTSKKEGNKKIFQANIKHPLYSDINSIILKQTGLDQIIEKVAKGIGDTRKVFVCGDAAKGKDPKIIDIIFVGTNIDKTYLISLVEKAEKLIRRKIRFLISESDEFEKIKNNYNRNEILLLWQS